MSEFYVYGHKVPGYSNFVYIGKGKNNRAYSAIGRNYIWKRLCSEGFEVHFFQDCLTEKESFELEIALIAKYDPCANLTKGGSGGYTHGHLPKDYISKKLSENKKEYWKNPTLGHREKTAKNGATYAKKYWSSLSEEEKSIEQSKRSNFRIRKKVYCINNNTTYESSKQTAALLGLKSADVVGKVAAGNKKSYKGYKFKYV